MSALDRVARALADASPEEEEVKRVTFRKTGKAHRGLMMPPIRPGEKPYLVAACSCPGSQRGYLTRGAQILCEGWERANCGN